MAASSASPAPPEKGLFGRAAPQPQGRRHGAQLSSRPAQQTKPTEACRNFSRGKCRRNNCKFSHTSASSSPATSKEANNANPNRQECSYCGKPGHVKKNCFIKNRDERKGNHKANAALTDHHVAFVSVAANPSLCASVLPSFPLWLVYVLLFCLFLRPASATSTNAPSSDIVPPCCPLRLISPYVWLVVLILFILYRFFATRRGIT